MPEFTPADLAVIIPTRERWGILSKTLEALENQTVTGFETIVVVDGADQSPPPLVGVRVIVQDHAGPGVARNRGVGASGRELVLFLGDDMIPTPGLVANHLEHHRRHPAQEVAVLGHVDRHPDVPRDRIERWLEWSGTQFDFPKIEEDDAGFGRFYSCNVSLKREFFLASGGFDAEFTFDYEDLDLGWRLKQRGMRLLYDQQAIVHHLHHHDLESMRRRYDSRARAERLMVAKHPWFTPYFAGRIYAAVGQRRARRLWPLVLDLIPARATRLRTRARERTDRWFHQRLAGAFLNAWEGERDLEELRTYLGDAFDIDLLRGHVAAVEQEERDAADEATFYRTSRMYLYDLTVFAMSGTKTPYLAALQRAVPPGSRLLDWGGGIGSDGLRLLEAGYEVAFAEFDNPSSQYLQWRLEHRGLGAPVYDLDSDDIPSDFDAAYSLDVIEHVDDPFAFLAELEQRAALIMVNFLEPEPGDTHLHKPLPIGALLDHAQKQGIVHYRRHHGRSHLVIYRTGTRTIGGQLRGRIERARGEVRPKLERVNRRARPVA